MEEELFINSSTYLESLCRARHLVKDNWDLAEEIEEVIRIEIKLAKLGSEKALEKASKSSAKIEEIKR